MISFRALFKDMEKYSIFKENKQVYFLYQIKLYDIMHFQKKCVYLMVNFFLNYIFSFTAGHRGQARFIVTLELILKRAWPLCCWVFDETFIYSSRQYSYILNSNISTSNSFHRSELAESNFAVKMQASLFGKKYTTDI